MIDMIVVHNICLPPAVTGADFDPAHNHVAAFFQNRLDPNAHPYFAEIYQQEVSAHLYIRRDGSLQQFVPFDKRAWHAGRSHWQGRDNCNDFSIGIELEGADHLPFTDAQYTALTGACRTLMAHYPIPLNRIVAHSDIAPGRKTDPGECFDWARLHDAITNYE